ncbi:Dabb family protein [Rhizobiaceae bacterium n13]|uniref:Dabb family protein n=1 Tax=Ferirhizobium litorale TaxID=2927786 RepID=A0AAE3QA11_9HYPH|nr:Dabb family protein [Fererhizobium litorale]MDI7861706.1 Dabb family protein [Fererhizobium litorale]MDI7921952.1 Dabb family protein [Fererhizobium litorale]
MIRHCVFIHFKPSVTEHEKAGLYAEIAGLKSRMPGLVGVHVGRNVSPETGMDKGYSEGFMVDFDGPAARDAYLADSEHRLTGDRIVAAAEGGLRGIIVYDLEIPD